MQVLDLWQSITGEKGVGLRSPHVIGHRTSSGQPYWFVGVDAVIVSEILDSKGEALSHECVLLSIIRTKPERFDAFFS